MLIYLDDPSTWPGDLATYVRDYPDEPDYGSIEHHRAIVEPRLYQSQIEGWHCTRLTESEGAEIEANGLRLLSPELVRDRVSHARSDGLIDSDLADVILQTNWSGQKHRKNRMAFVGARSPFRTRHHGIGHFLREWGGEAIAFALEKTRHQAILSTIGTRTVVEAAINMSDIDHIWPDVWTVMWKGVHTPDDVDGAIVTSALVPASAIIDLIQPGSLAWKKLFPE